MGLYGQSGNTSAAAKEIKVPVTLRSTEMGP
jgi:hypothetical protein